MRSVKLATFAAAAAMAVATLQPVTASAAGVYVPPVTVRPPVGVIVGLAAVSSVILDGIYIAVTQCREMTADEAATAFFPVIGPAYNATKPNKSKCKK